MSSPFEGFAEKYLERLVSTVRRLNFAQLDRALEIIAKAWENGNQVICLGNGGSALTAQHYVNDWNKSIYLSTGRPFLGRCLTDNMGLVLAYANDFCFEDVFVEQLKPILRPQDLVIGISGSGNSENVLRAISYANDHEAVTLGICGYDGGALKTLAQHHLWADVNDMQLAEDVHFFFGHLVMQALCGSTE
jgi:D-sedoheptulose 7-phosphate isomerase